MKPKPFSGSLSQLNEGQWLTQRRDWVPVIRAFKEPRRQERELSSHGGFHLQESVQ